MDSLLQNRQDNDLSQRKLELRCLEAIREVQAIVKPFGHHIERAGRSRN
jgi:hypothetical protein